MGIEVYRNRSQRLLWLTQRDYIEKIADLVKKEPRNHKTPMTQVEFVKYLDVVTGKEVREYQIKVGSMLYIAVVTRPDVAFAVSRLAQFNSNSSPAHHAAIDRVIHYLLALRLSTTVRRERR